mgnify:CR=1 FL=1
MTKTRTALLLLMLPLAAACANAPRPMRELPPPAPTSYFSAPVRAGDNLKALADRYKVKEDDLLAMNDFGRGEALKAGSTSTLKPCSGASTHRRSRSASWWRRTRA